MLVESHTDPTGPEIARVERAIRYLARNRLEQPGLDEVADVMGLSPFHAQRVFAGVVGVSPKQFLGLLTVEHAKALLRGGAGESVLGAALEVGLSGPSRLHDLFVKIEAITPGEYRAEGRGLTMRWGVHPTPFGDALFVVSDRGLARLAFVAEAGPAGALAEARADWPLSTFVEDPAGTADCAARAFASLTGRGDPAGAPIRLLVKGSPFQLQVWRALVRIPQGAAVTYGTLALALGSPGAARAVGSACGRNRIGYLIPCHRVIRETGALGGYHWGLDLKRSLLRAESSPPPPAAAVA
jgi:AraC family transcriptional regulator, regulatory protein of adaptative response / methylated-DNA-[protein]-cysteine methyltransferase